MPTGTEREVDALFEATRPRVDDIASGYRRQLPLRIATGAFGCLPALAAAFMVLTQRVNPFHETRFYVIAFVGIGVCLAAAVWLFRRLAGADQPFHDQADRELVQPLAALLVQGAVFSRPSLVAADWSRPRLLPETNGTPWMTKRLTGRVAGLPAALDEGDIVFSAGPESAGSDGPWKWSGWRVRLELPFTVGGHLRVRASLASGHSDRERRRAFTPQPDATTRVGGERSVEIAPPGYTYAGVPRATDVAPGALLTDELVALLASDQGLQLAALESELWILLARRRDAFEGSYRKSFDRDVWRAAARSMDLVERVARAVLAAGGR